MQPFQVSQTVMDEYAARILLGTTDRAASARDLSRRYGIPIAACYRRIRRLQNLGLVYCAQEVPSRNGKGLQMFRSRLKTLRVMLSEGRLRAYVEFEPTAPESQETPEAEEQELELHENEIQ